MTFKLLPERSDISISPSSSSTFPIASNIFPFVSNLLEPLWYTFLSSSPPFALHLFQSLFFRLGKVQINLLQRSNVWAKAGVGRRQLVSYITRYLVQSDAERGKAICFSCVFGEGVYLPQYAEGGGLQNLAHLVVPFTVKLTNCPVVFVIYSSIDCVRGTPVAVLLEVKGATEVGGCVLDSQLPTVFEVFGADHEVSHERRRLLPISKNPVSGPIYRG